MKCVIATPEQIAKLTKVSVKMGNIPFFPDRCIAAIFEHDNEIVGFAAVQSAWHAAGSWVKEEFRGQKWTYEMRQALDNELRKRGVFVYFALPGNDFEKALFRKYGHTTEHLVQVRHL